MPSEQPTAWGEPDPSLATRSDSNAVITAFTEVANALEGLSREQSIRVIAAINVALGLNT